MLPCARREFGLKRSVDQKCDSPLVLRQETVYPSCRSGREVLPTQRIDLPQGTLDLLILRTLGLGPQHGWGISERVQQMSSDVLCIQQGSLYPALHRLELDGLIDSEWGQSANNRRAKFYRLTARGRKQFSKEASHWKQLAEAITRVMETT